MAKKMAKRAKPGKTLNEKIEDLINLIEGLPRHHYAAPGAIEYVEARLKEKGVGLLAVTHPEHQQPDHRTTQRMQDSPTDRLRTDPAEAHRGGARTPREPRRTGRSPAAIIVESGLEIAGDRHYNYGYGVLLRKSDLDRLIWCLKTALAALSGKRGPRPIGEDERRKKVYQDYDLFCSKLTEGKLLYPDNWDATKKWVMAECKKEWHVDDRQANNRIKAIREYEPELFAYANLDW